MTSSGRVPGGRTAHGHGPAQCASRARALGVHPARQSCGIGTLLIRSAEQRIGARSLTRAELGVEESNPRARALYERLGYRAFSREFDSWDVEAEDGSLQRYEAMCTLMCKDLT